MRRFKRYFMLVRIFLVRGGYKRALFLKKSNYFKSQGEHCLFQPWNFGTEPNLISFGNNVHIASGVTFINHDVIGQMIGYMDERKYKNRVGEIKIGDNVFIGTNSTILYDVNIGNNVIIGAGSLVNKDIPSGVVAVGVPCKVVGSFEDYRSKFSAMQDKMN